MHGVDPATGKIHERRGLGCFLFRSSGYLSMTMPLILIRDDIPLVAIPDLVDQSNPMTNPGETDIPPSLRRLFSRDRLGMALAFQHGLC